MSSEVVTGDAELQHVSNLTFKTFTKRFNKEYSGKLHEEQASLLNKFIYSFADNGISLKVYLNEEIGRLKEAVKKSMELEDIASDTNMLSNATKVLSILENFKNEPLTETGVKKILKIQELAREVSE